MRASKWKHTELLATEGCVGQVFHLLKATDGGRSMFLFTAMAEDAKTCVCVFQYGSR